MGEHQEERAQQQLVCDGVEIQAEGGVLFGEARRHAVEAVAEAGQHEERKGQAMPPVQDRDHQKRDDEQTHQA